MSALAWCAGIFAAVCAATWLLSLISGEHSWVDRIWSIVPIAYLAVFAAKAGWADPRLDVMVSLSVLWGARLTFNFARKGGYRPGGEDYRWAVLRAKMSRWQFQLFNLFFIALYQNVILLLIALPGYTALQHRGGFGAADAVLAGLFLLCLAGETVADQQQWNFHAWKRVELAAGRTPRSQFRQTGLFRYSRHPNFFFEQAMWWLMYAFGAVAAGRPLTWTIAGAVLLTLLFVGSTRFTESISAAKYPEYAHYQTTTSAVIPWPPRLR
jgi:steroid 5-alpha reductase family enzyme